MSSESQPSTAAYGFQSASPSRRKKVSRPASGLPLLLRKNGTRVELELEDVAALNDNVYLWSSPRNLGIGLFDVRSPAGKLVCNVNPNDSGAPAGKLREPAFDPTLGDETTGLWCFLVSADNGVAGPEGILGRDSTGAVILPTRTCK